jgi:hypothetical protein
MILSFDLGTKHLALCKLNIDTSKQFEIIDWQVISVVDHTVNVNKTSIEELVLPFTNCIVKHLDQWLADVDTVFIESQPMGRTKNVKTKILSHILQSYIQQKKSTLIVQFIHPSLKLKDMVGPRTYRENKKFAIQKTEELLGTQLRLNAAKCKELFVHKKRDDLADAFLQGYYASFIREGSKTTTATEKATKLPKVPKAKPAKKRARTEINVD